MLTPDDGIDITELFVAVLRQNPEAVIRNLNRHLETADFEIVLKRIDVQTRYAEARKPPTMSSSNPPALSQ